jgi:hypothetical protein
MTPRRIATSGLVLAILALTLGAAEILGEPTSTGRHVTGKAFILFYFGTDAVKTEWRFKSLGRAIFSKGSFSASHVSAVEYHPHETGADR